VKITSLEPERGGKHTTVHFDNSRRILLNSEVVITAGLKVGQELDEKALARLRDNSRFQMALEVALRYLEYRPRSEKEVCDRLRRDGYSGNITDRVMAHLRSRKLIDDRAFARYWREGRASNSPRSRRAVKGELLAKGVSRETADAATADMDDETTAYEIGRKKARSLAGLDRDAFRKKLGSYLQRRGFDYEVIVRTIKRLQRELPS
jgi:regulatory protein